MSGPSVVTVYGDAMLGVEIADCVFSGPVDVHVSLAGEHRANGDGGGAQWTCAYCEGELVEEWQQSADGKVGAEVFVGLDGSAECRDNEDENGLALPHEAERVPLSWANSARISMDEEADSITVTISVGDPRGAFALTIEQHEGQLSLSVPHESDSFLHRPLLPVNGRGYFRVG